MIVSRCLGSQGVVVTFYLLGLVEFVVGSNGGVPLFQSTSADVVRNLVNGETYEEIYLKYHRCVWSEYGNSAGDYDNGCGGDGNGNVWYMGRTPCYRANVAYSLYGVLKGENATDNPCKRGTFINSFFSTDGVETFAESLGIDNGDATDQCEVYSVAEDDTYKNGDAASENNQMLYPTYSSFTTSCGADGSFIQGLFKGAYCSSREGVTSLDTLTDFNSAVDNLECSRIYSSTDGVDMASNLLLYSESCSKLEYPLGCPDPFEVKSSMEFRPKSQLTWWNRMTWMDHVALAFLSLAALFFIIPCCNLHDDDDSIDKPKRRRFLCPRRQANGERSSGGFRQWFRTKVLRRRN